MDISLFLVCVGDVPLQSLAQDAFGTNRAFEVGERSEVGVLESPYQENPPFSLFIHLSAPPYRLLSNNPFCQLSDG